MRRIKLINAMVEPNEAFTGTWAFNAQRSKLSTPLPHLWIQTIMATHHEIIVREEIVRSNGERSAVFIWAKFDGSDYPISGLPIADSIAYTRNTAHSISGTGKKNGVVSLNETVTVAPDGRSLTLIYSVQTGASPVARGIAVFDRETLD